LDAPRDFVFDQYIEQRASHCASVNGAAGLVDLIVVATTPRDHVIDVDRKPADANAPRRKHALRSLGSANKTDDSFCECGLPELPPASSNQQGYTTT
jgi:hypothetical protein